MAKVIDLFAGPGGLGEGFSAFTDRRGERPFKIAMSVEKEASAHATLTLRAFLRHFDPSDRPRDYEDFRAGKISLEDLKSLYPEQFALAEMETLGGPTELGKDNDFIESRVKELIKSRGDEPWIVIGGPPCQAYSLAGRSRNKGVQGYRPEADERNFLYREYLKILALARPEVFVMENVRGILSARVNGRLIFEDILEDLRAPGRAENVSGASDLHYQIYSLVTDKESPAATDYLIHAEDYGVPQCRHRVILLGVRSDLTRKPETLQESQHKVSVKSVISGLPSLRSKVSRGGDSAEKWWDAISSRIRFLLDSGKLEDSTFADHLANQLRRLRSHLPTEHDQYPGQAEESFGDQLPEKLRTWLTGTSKTLTGHQARGHMPSDLARYFFASAFASWKGASPKAEDFPAELAPDHANWKSGHFADRFRVQLDKHPSTTITSHISKDGHYFIHYDPLQCRSLTVREAARLQTFPDDYHFMGNRTQQYVQVGNAVPPFLAYQIAEVVHKLLD